MLFVQYGGPRWYFGYSRKHFLMGKQYFLGLFRFSYSGTRNIVFGTFKIGQNDPEIPNLEFENLGVLENQVFLPTEQAGTNIC